MNVYYGFWEIISQKKVAFLIDHIRETMISICIPSYVNLDYLRLR